jgi:hypothetical protein
MRVLINRIELSLILIFLAGCASTRPSQLYVLTAQSEPHAAAAAIQPIGLNFVEVAPYLDRAQIVTRRGRNRVHAAEYHRWAEPLADGVHRVLAENLSRRLGGAVVITTGASPTISASVHIIRFEASDGGNVILTAQWRVTRGAVTDTVRQAECKATAVGSSYDVIVAAMSTALSELAGRIVEDLIMSNAP